MTDSAPRPRGRPGTSADTRARLIAAAIEVFPGRGYAHTRVQGITHAAGFTTPFAIQTKAIVIPKVRATGDFSIREDSNVDTLEVPAIPGLTDGFPVINPGDQNWSAGIYLVQSLFEGGRMSSSLKTARWLKAHALAQHQTVLADVATDLRVGDAIHGGGEAELTRA